MKLVALVLAAGASSRFGSNKLSADLHGEPLLHHAIRAARAAPVERVIVIARAGLDAGEWKGAPVVQVVPTESDALSTSLKAGITQAAGADGAFIFLGDMPAVPHEIAGRLAAKLNDHFAVVPVRSGKQGHPVLLSARAFPEIMALTGDKGAGALLRGRDDVVFDECTDSGIHFDVDRPDDLAMIANGRSGES